MMMEINLLPHREARRAADLRETVAVLVLGLVVVGGGIFLTDKGVKSDLDAAEASVAQLQADIERYEPQKKLVKKFKKRKKQLKSKLDVIDSLEQARNGPVRVLDELSERVPDRLWLTSVEGQSYAEVAAALQVSEQAVKSLVHRARSALAERLKAAREAPS